MPSLLSGVSSVLSAARNTIKAAALARSSQAALSSLVNDAKDAVNKARQQLADASTAFGAVNKQVRYCFGRCHMPPHTAVAVNWHVRVQNGSVSRLSKLHVYSYCAEDDQQCLISAEAFRMMSKGNCISRVDACCSCSLPGRGGRSVRPGLLFERVAPPHPPMLRAGH